MTFYDELHKYDYQQVVASFDTITEEDVLRAIATPNPTVEDFKALISPKAVPFLDQIATRANTLTIERFGRTIQLYLPLYLSNYCTNSCIYCGFNHENEILRKKLSLEEIDEEIEAIKKLGFKHLLIVAGEHPRIAGIDYYCEVIQRLRPHFAQISIEVQPLREEEYRKLVAAGVSCVCVYQETYNEESYPTYHPRGLKANFRYRLETPDRAASAGIKKIGIGALLGLDNWFADAFFTAVHLKYLEKNYWKSKYSISLPRLRPHVGSYMPQRPITDKEMAQLICAFRILSPQVEISLSTRESAPFRNMAMRIGVNTMSAGSSTQPGGYAHPNRELEQFSINDNRTPQEMQQAIIDNGYEPVWKDWDLWI